jgi:hypothetical protein
MLLRNISGCIKVPTVRLILKIQSMSISVASCKVRDGAAVLCSRPFAATTATVALRDPAATRPRPFANGLTKFT